MTEIHGPGGPLPPIPDDMTVSQFMFTSYHLPRPQISNPGPWLIEDATGRKVYGDEVRTRTWGLANALSSRWHAGEDDVVCIFSPNHIDYPIVVWAVHTLGAIVTAANPSYSADELEYQLSTTKTKVIVTGAGSYSIALDAARKVGLPLDHVVLFDPLPDGSKPCPTVSELVAEATSRHQASGTTGKPKAVCIPHYAPIANVIQMAHEATQQQKHMPWERKTWRWGDISAGVLPFYHIFGLVVVMHFSIYYGMSLVIVPKFNFVEFLKSIQRHRINYLNIVPPMHPASKDYDLSSLRGLMSGAAPLSVELIHALAQRLPHCHIGQGYGMTETSTTVTWPQSENRLGAPGSAGRIIAGCVVRIVRPDGSLAGYNEPGQLVVKSPSMALRYMNNEQATKETFRDGWVWTGDEVVVNENADLFVVDRIKELLKVKGFQVAPAELEGHILNHPDVSDVCVVGVPDDYSGELPLAFVVPSAAAAARMKAGDAETDRVRAALIKHVADAKIEYKHLTGGVVFVDTIPKNPSGKLLRRFLRDHARKLQKQGKLVAVPRAKSRAKL
ncbi:amp dependent CoA ligase [Amylocystis lapponica]|nr:amp dependent CoA ligase [Amylocystis lapponica]